jgi:hypothetical protein
MSAISYPILTRKYVLTADNQDVVLYNLGPNERLYIKSMLYNDETTVTCYHEATFVQTHTTHMLGGAEQDNVGRVVSNNCEVGLIGPGEVRVKVNGGATGDTVNFTIFGHMIED